MSENLKNKRLYADIQRTLDIFNLAGKSKKSIIETDLGSIRSTLFGKFYEGVIAGYLVEKEGYKYLGKAAVYWEQCQKSIKKDDFSFSLNQSLQDMIDNNKTRANSDGLYEKDGKYLLWEAKNWARWDEGKPTIKEQVRDLLKISPWLLGTKGKVKGKEYNIDKVIFSWWDEFKEYEKWDEFKEYEKLEKEVSDSIGKPFKIIFTSNLLDDCRKKKYKWYINIINEQKKNIDEFFAELLGEK